MAAVMKAKKSPPPKVPGGGPPLLVREKSLPALLGVSRATIRRAMAAGRFPPAIRWGGCVAWRYADVMAWVEAGCKV
jgi:predicted DNA-binding transcriptional regulator AlpA